MDLDVSDFDLLEIAARCDALFELYDDVKAPQSANDDMYDNIYPNIA